jgi:peptidoglycan-N-acetylglucosamine deacetylase
VRLVQIRRRRLAAVAAGLVLLVVLLVALVGSHGRAAGNSTRHAAVHRRSGSPITEPTDTEADRRAAVGSVLGYTPFVKEGSGRAHDVALTFDDGPGPYTPEVLSVLERLHAPATFFTIGRMLRYFSASTAREIRDGDAIGDHTENHPMMASLSSHDQREELLEPIIRIEALGGTRPVLFRPPYGSFDATTFHVLKEMRLLMVLWSVDTSDYQLPGVQAIVQRALAGAHPGAIILMHDGGGDRSETIAALPQIIRGLRARHLHIVTVPQMMLDEPPPHGLPLPGSLAGD